MAQKVKNPHDSRLPLQGKTSSVRGWESKIPHALWPKIKKKKKSNASDSQPSKPGCMGPQQCRLTSFYWPLFYLADTAFIAH